jgi:hypothetical protein
VDGAPDAGATLGSVVEGADDLDGVSVAAWAGGAEAAPGRAAVRSAGRETCASLVALGALVAGAGAADLVPDEPLPPASFSLSRRTTGASSVEEADRTNSPMSFASARTVLLSTPSSFASS